MDLFFGTPPAAGMRPAILLDRDGVINQRIRNGYVSDWKDFQFLPDIQRVLVSLSQLGLPMVVVSNQAGVGKGLLQPPVLLDITKRFVEALLKEGARIDAVYYCLHTPTDDCSCRKPRPGLLKRAAKDWCLDLTRSVLIGDSPSDAEAATAVNCKAILMVSSEAGPAALPPSLQSITVRKPCELPQKVCQLLELPQALPTQA